MPPDFLRRFLGLCATGLAIGSVLFLIFGGWRAATAYAFTFALVAADFLWIASAVRKVLGEARPARRTGAVLFVGMLARTLLLLLVLYGILTLLPRESLGVVAGIGGPLVLLVIAGAVRTRG